MLKKMLRALVLLAAGFNSAYADCNWAREDIAHQMFTLAQQGKRSDFEALLQKHAWDDGLVCISYEEVKSGAVIIDVVLDDVRDVGRRSLGYEIFRATTSLKTLTKKGKGLRGSKLSRVVIYVGDWYIREPNEAQWNGDHQVEIYIPGDMLWGYARPKIEDALKKIETLPVR